MSTALRGGGRSEDVKFGACAEHVNHLNRSPDIGLWNSRMSSRLFSLFLAIVFLGSGLGTSDPLRAAAAPSTEQQRDVSQGAGSAVHNDGLVEDHSVDSLPFQAHTDPTAETPGLLQAAFNVAIPVLVLVRARAFEVNDTCAPYLEGLLRPPRGASFSA